MCIASSRMGRSPEQAEGWIEALRTSCLSAARDRALVMVVENSSTGPWVQRMAQWLGLGTVTLRRAPNKPNEAWWSAAARRAGSQDFPVWIFEPPEDLSHGAAGSQKAGRQRESLDHWAIGFSDQVRVLRVTDGGNVFHAIESRLQRSLSPGSLWLLIGSSAVPDHLRLRWLALGAIDWCLAPSEPDPEPASAAANRSANDAGQAGGPILETLPEDIDDFLSHWTRTPSAPGSSEPGFQHLDRVLWGDQGSLQGPASALLSIVATGRIHASGRMTRESHPVVCFTAVPLPDFRRRRVFRPHLCRWDFEAFGIAVRKSRLERLGARPVIYGDDQTWQSLSADDRIRFQASRTPLNPDATDWSDEREWRLAGDLNLSLFGPSDCLVFVGDGESARAIAPYSRWPVVILPPSG